MKVLKNHEFQRKAPGSRKHDWNTLLDGQIREVGADDMGDAKPSTFGSQFRTQAKKRGLSAHIQGTEDGKGLIVQAVPKAKDATPAPKAGAKK